MGVSIVNENSFDFSEEFVPFDDSGKAREAQMVADTSLATTNSIDTQTYDQYRQGISLKTEKHLVQGFGAKIWSGNIKGYTRVRTYGQTLPFTEFQNNKSFYDRPKFDSTRYLQMGADYPKPIMFNDGPQQSKECIIMPLTIPFRKGFEDNEGPEYAHSPKAFLEDGNPIFEQINGHSNKIKQFIDFKAPKEAMPFLDEGSEYIGTGYGYTSGSVTGSISVGGFIDYVSRSIEPYDDTADQSLLLELTTGSIDMARAVNALSGFNLDMDLRKGVERKSATAGYSVYGPGAGRTGTDSWTFNGFLRGS
jgi:hypothetical protein